MNRDDFWDLLACCVFIGVGLYVIILSAFWAATW